MTLLTRMTRLLKADLHGILDCLEEPEEVLKQTIRDMEEALAHKEHTLTELHTVLQRLTTEDTAVARARQDIEQNIAICFQAGNETLARSFIRKRLETERQARQMARLIEDTRARHAALEHLIAEQREQLAAVVQQLNMLLATRQRQEGQPAPYAAGYSGAAVTDDEVEVAFLEEQRRRTGPAPTR